MRQTYQPDSVDPGIGTATVIQSCADAKVDAPNADTPSMDDATIEAQIEAAR